MIVVSEGIGIKSTNDSHECIVCHYNHYNYFTNSSISFNTVSIVTVIRSNYRIHFWFTKSC